MFLIQQMILLVIIFMLIKMWTIQKCKIKPFLNKISINLKLIKMKNLIILLLMNNNLLNKIVHIKWMIIKKLLITNNNNSHNQIINSLLVINNIINNQIIILILNLNNFHLDIINSSNRHHLDINRILIFRWILSLKFRILSNNKYMGKIKIRKMNIPIQI